MRNWICASVLLAIPVVAMAADAPPDWAYPATPPGYRPPPDNGQPQHLAGSTKAFTQKDVDNAFAPPDWFPDEHPPMPELVAHGKQPVVHACDQCHLATGSGHPESANLTGLPVGYIEEQLREFRSGNRKSSVNARSVNMIAFAGALSDDEVKSAAEYFASIKPVVWTEVKETDTVPKTYVTRARARLPVEGGGMEPIGNRIIEVPQDPKLAMERDPHSGFIAYVPMGSVAKGEQLATNGGGGKTVQCAICHGDGLTGMGDVSRIAGLAPSYIARQLYNFQSGASNGSSAQLMKPVVMNLTDEDILNLAAYVASQAP